MLKVLIVDDNKETAFYIQTRFKVMGHQADALSDAKEALKVASSLKAKEYDYFLLDIYLNGINGLDIFKALKDQGLEKKVIFISGCDEKSEIFHKAMALNVPILIKMVSIKDMLQNMIDGTVRDWSEEQLKLKGFKRELNAEA